MGLCGSMRVYVGLHRGLFLRCGGEKNQDFMLIRLFNPNDLIGCLRTLKVHHCLSLVTIGYP